MKTILFDIDGTLITTGGAGSATLYEAFEAEFGIVPSGDVPVHGRTDRAIGANIFALHDVEDSESNWDRFREAYLQRLPAAMHVHEGSLLPNVVDLLNKFKDDSQIAMGLLTGNAPLGAEIKLKYFGLWDFFSFGGFGDRHHCRNDVAQQAVESAQKHLGEEFDAEQLWVIGDTPADIECGHAVAARAIGITTGKHTRQELEAAGADDIIDDIAKFDVG